MKKILIIGNFSFDGGVVTWLNYLIKILSNDSLLFIISPGYCSRQDGFNNKNLIFYEIPILKPYSINTLLKVKNIIKFNKINIIISSELIFSIIPLILFYFLRFKLFIIVHGVSSEWCLKFKFINSILFFIYRTFSNIATFISISNFIKSYLKNNGIDSKLIYNPIISPKFEPSKTKKSLKNIFFIGRLDYEKGPDIFYEISKYLINKDYKFFMFGNGLFYELLDNLKKTDMAHNFIIQNWATIDSDFFSSCDAVLITSRYEGLSYVALESMMHGIPVIAIDVGGLREIVINNLTGYLFTTKNDVINFLFDIDSGKVLWNPQPYINNAYKFVLDNMDISVIKKEYKNILF